MSEKTTESIVENAIDRVVNSITLRLMDRLAVAVGLPSAAFLSWLVWSGIEQLKVDTVTIKVGIATLTEVNLTQDARASALSKRVTSLETRLLQPGRALPHP